ncbi:hypothetical protein FS764_22775 [Agrobacterium vitis]|uniref:hypothetical protein n=1 Tax=Agrobacterium vitis TaxID=373 RepID=UPI001F379B88|nr:hypothetical protein [Agrobacterium vitis]MCF1469706.1 hypothetical protein [Agrobacterium vitis]
MGLFAFLRLSRTGAAHEVFEDCPLVEKLGPPLARCKGQDRRKIAPQHDHQFRPIGHEIDAPDQRAESVGRQRPRFFIAQLVVESSYLRVTILGQIGMEQGRRFFCAVEEGGTIAR